MYQYEISFGYNFKFCDLNSDKIEGFYKTDNIINDIAFRACLFFLCDLNTYFQL